MYCRYCGNPLQFNNQKFCSVCGVPTGLKKERSKAAKFFLSLLWCAGYYALFYGIIAVIQFGYQAVVMASLTGHSVLWDANGYMGMSEAFWSAFSENICWIMTLAYIIVLLTYNLIFVCRKKRPLDEVGVRRTQPASAPLAFIFGAALEVAVVFIINILANMFPAIADSATVNDEMNRCMFMNSSVLSQFVFVAVITPVMEEVIFRGLIYSRMKKGMPQAAAMILSAVVFGCAHSGAVQFTYAAALGIIMVLLYEKYESLLPCIFLHAGFNSVSFIYDYLNLDSILVQYSLMALSAGLVLLFIAYFFVSKPIYEEERS